MSSNRQALSLSCTRQKSLTAAIAPSSSKPHTALTQRGAWRLSRVALCQSIHHLSLSVPALRLTHTDTYRHTHIHTSKAGACSGRINRGISHSKNTHTLQTALLLALYCGSGRAVALPFLFLWREGGRPCVETKKKKEEKPKLTHSLTLTLTLSLSLSLSLPPSAHTATVSSRGSALPCRTQYKSSSVLRENKRKINTMKGSSAEPQRLRLPACPPARHLCHLPHRHRRRRWLPLTD